MKNKMKNNSDSETQLRDKLIENFKAWFHRLSSELNHTYNDSLVYRRGGLTITGVDYEYKEPVVDVERSFFGMNGHMDFTTKNGNKDIQLKFEYVPSNEEHITLDHYYKLTIF